MHICVFGSVCVCALNLPDAFIVPGQPECPVFCLAQRTFVITDVAMPLVIYRILLIVSSTNVNSPAHSIITKIK